jgi:hypothetical protein
MQVVTEIVFHGFARLLAVCDFAAGHSYLVVPPGGNVSLTLHYARDLTVRVRDNGTGIPGDFARNGKPGHFGLSGMQERAIRVGGRLRVVSNPDAGTDVELVVPGPVVFCAVQPAWRRFFNRTRHPFELHKDDTKPNKGKSIGLNKQVKLSSPFAVVPAGHRVLPNTGSPPSKHNEIERSVSNREHECHRAYRPGVRPMSVQALSEPAGAPVSGCASLVCCSGSALL